MKTITSLCLFFVLTLGVPAGVGAQRRLPANGLTRLVDALERAIGHVAPGWELTDVPPTAPPGSEPAADGISITQWTLNEQRVRVVIIRHASPPEAAQALQQFATDKKATSAPDVMSDEAYVWGLRNSIAFRKNSFTIYINAVVTLPDDETTPQTTAQRAQAEHAKESALSRLFAHHAAAVLAAN